MNEDIHQKNEYIISYSGEKDEEDVEAFVSSVLNTFDCESSSNNDSEDSNINNNEEVAVDRSPLGLKLSKTPSFMNLLSSKIQSVIDQKIESTDSANKKSEKSDSIQDTNTFTDEKFKKSDSIQYKDTSTRLKSRKLKASNFPMKCINIGAWQRVSRYEGELVTKFYYAKKKIIWEFIDGPLKSKIEILCSDISAIKAILLDNQNGVLAIELNNPPTFFKEIDPQPRKHCLWKTWIDFTGNYASICRRHCGQFAANVLNYHYEKLLQCDPRLFELNQQPFPSSQSPFFSSFKVTIPRNTPPILNNLGPKVPLVVQYSNPNPTRIVTRGVSPMVQNPNPRNPTIIAIGETSPMVQCLNPSPNPTRMIIGEVLSMRQNSNANRNRNPSPAGVAIGEVSPMLHYPNSQPTKTIARGVSPIMQYPNPNPNSDPITRYPNNPTREAFVRATPSQAFIRPPLIDRNGRPINRQVVNRRPPQMVNCAGPNSNFKLGQSMLASQNCDLNDHMELNDIENLIIKDYQECNR